MRSLSFDAKPSGNKFKASQAAEREFYKALKQVALKSGHVVDVHAEGANLKNERQMMEILERYSKSLEPWARRQSEKFLSKIDKTVNRNYKSNYEKNANAMAKALRDSGSEQKMIRVATALVHEQVGLIQSIPLEAALRAQKIAFENVIQGRRATPDQSVIDQLVTEMGMSTEVAVNRAMLIARTETARSNQAFVETRALNLQSPGYIWMTTMDGAERHSHAKMNGKFVAWNQPPVLEDGTVGHAGTFPNCRCWQDVVLPDDPRVLKFTRNKSFLEI